MVVKKISGAGGSVTLVLDPDGPGDARELVGERAGGLVVVAALLHGERPGPESVDVASGAPCHGGCAQDRTRPVGEQHAEVAVAALTLTE